MSGISSIGSGHDDLEAAIRHASRNTVTLIPFQVHHAGKALLQQPVVLPDLRVRVLFGTCKRECLTRPSLVTNWQAYIGEFM